MARKSNHINPFYQNKLTFRKQNRSLGEKKSVPLGPCALSDLVSKDKLRLLPPSVRSVIKDRSNSLPKIHYGRRSRVGSSQFKRSLATEIVKASSEAVIKAFGDSILQVSDNPEHIHALGAMVASQAVMMARQLPFRPAKVNSILDTIGNASIIYEISPQGAVATHVSVSVEKYRKAVTKGSNDNKTIIIQNLNVYFTIPYVENFYHNPQQVINFNVDPFSGKVEEIKKLLLDGEVLKMLLEKANVINEETEEDTEENTEEANPVEQQEENADDSSDENQETEDVKTTQEENIEEK